MNHYVQKFVILFIALALFTPLTSEARLGVGVGSGKVQVDGALKPGGFYELPLLPVLNTGDQPTDYGVSAEFNENQKEKKPAKSWFEFSPATFHLESGKVQTVKIVLNIPIKTEPGEYFAYLEAHPIATPENGVTSVGIAAATKLYFTVAPANFFQGVYYKVSFFMKKYTPWSWTAFGILVFAVLATAFVKKFDLSISLSKK